jgi:hypothetical protein
MTERYEFIDDFRDERDPRFTLMSFTGNAKDEACVWRRRHRNSPDERLTWALAMSVVNRP